MQGNTTVAYCLLILNGFSNKLESFPRKRKHLQNHVIFCDESTIDYYLAIFLYPNLLFLTMLVVALLGHNLSLLFWSLHYSIVLTSYKLFAKEHDFSQYQHEHR
ncbi:hypothetical protein ACJX0J_012233 [Zea mays]